MKLQLVSFEQARALEELGLPHLDHEGFCYRKNGTLTQPIYTGEWCNTFAPTLELAAKWLREEKKIDIEVYRYEDNIVKSVREYTFRIFAVYNWTQVTNKYDIALSAGIDKAIEILKQNETDNNN